MAVRANLELRLGRLAPRVPASRLARTPVAAAILRFPEESLPELAAEPPVAAKLEVLHQAPLNQVFLGQRVQESPHLRLHLDLAHRVLVAAAVELPYLFQYHLGFQNSPGFWGCFDPLHAPGLRGCLSLQHFLGFWGRLGLDRLALPCCRVGQAGCFQTGLLQAGLLRLQGSLAGLGWKRCPPPAQSAGEMPPSLGRVALLPKRVRRRTATAGQPAPRQDL